MTEIMRTPLAACPACATGAAVAGTGDGAAEGRLMLSLPGIHCAGCISGVERGLKAVPGVREARVNLTLKRAAVEAAEDVTAADLVAALDRLGFEAHELDPGTISATDSDSTGRELLMRLAVAGFAMMNVMLLSVAVWSGAEDATRDLMHWISAMIALPAVAFSGQPFFRNALTALTARRLNMDVPISVAIVMAAGMSLYETAMSGEHAYFDAALALTFFLLAGRYLDYRTRAAARSAAQELAALEVPRATRLVDGREVVTPIAELSAGDLVRVRPGGRMPVDGVVETGTSEIDRALLTGESLPVFAGEGSTVSAGEVNLTGPLDVRVTARGADTRLHKIADLVALAESARTRYTSLADRAAVAYAPGVHLLALIAFAAWMIWSGDLRVSVNVAIATLIITCPCALGLAVPAVVTAASGRLFRRGVLLKSGTALERLAEVDTVVFDKTGTLTLGQPEMQGAADHARTDLAVAAGLASASAHPLAQALRRAAEAEGVAPAAIAGLREVPGYGVEGRWGDHPVRFGRAAWTGGADGPGTASFLRIGDRDPVRFDFTDALRPGAAEAVAALRAAGCRVMLISGDSAPAVEATAKALGIAIAESGALPKDKVARVQALEAEGHKVLMVGDGLNDTGALAAAHVSISPASALDAARVASDIVLLGRDLDALADCLTTARQARARIKENFTLSALYNVIAVPIALAGLATPLIAALAMSASSITVSLNALRLR
ncbi:cadmium-translocating P-type ATPase [Maritimibacter sp. 55A14]|uniref:heavy metal translocating P-type ATPase n=1 Tax=Maritimibacter sp. 55A14 TaxID=2174844 RepID=UPI000D61A127|nr:heavy metal translocating P-type ATPase [Maritimibacter sp. 55A14]PWE32263.1 cadmium-translocating P-type ATPase [Maritimibacter sp. 55A14]